MGRFDDDDQNQEKSAGPWYSVRGPVSQQIGKVTTKKIQCGVCELYFLPNNLTGIACWKSVLTQRAKWGLAEADEKLKKWAPTRLYNSVKLCSFCAQLLIPDEVVQDTASPKKALPYGNQGGQNAIM